ncbi:TRA-1 regulated domain-containing protein [Caenorhabditis elegans]|nr:Secreted protein [Caenorhabditis elegans]CUR30026.1 Secreted protein [Caenorhabditis elegans]|eukprot:NP_001303727.1 Uncharacterized protein CELE_F41B5.12 [Caenorhabditis elegans]
MPTTMAMESTTEKVCLDTKNSPCGKLENKFILNGVKVEYVERNGCTVPRCPNMLLPSVFFVNSKSEIPIIDPLKPSFTIRVLPPLKYAELEASSFTEYYGLSCEGSAWTISNYPHGTTTPTNGVAAGRDGSTDGKKSPIDFIGW